MKYCIVLMFQEIGKLVTQQLPTWFISSSELSKSQMTKNREQVTYGQIAREKHLHS